MGSKLALTSPGGNMSVQITIGNERYLARPYKDLKAVGTLSDYRPTLLTVFHVGNQKPVDRGFLEHWIEIYLRDDVFKKECLEGIVFQSTGHNEPQITDDAEALMATWQTAWRECVQTHRKADVLPTGPYYLDEGGLYQLYKIQDDVNHAFVVAAVESSTDPKAWEDPQTSAASYTCVGVPVPSRLYFEPTEGKPFNGMRIAVKDVFHMKGLKTSVCNRAYHDWFPGDEDTATSLKLLVDRGAQIVGKTHLSSFAWREEPTECIDYQAPFNPRADGYQSPAGSSSGSGAAIVSYDWLDFTIGTDTTGSGRRPALWNGCFALRPSAGALPTQGMVPTCPPFDVPSFFGRNLSTFSYFISSWYIKNLEPKTHPESPWSIVYPTDYMEIDNLEQRRLDEEFAFDLGKYLNAEVKKLSIAEEWKKTTPVQENDLVEYMRDVQEHGFYYDALHCFDRFLKEYKDKHGHEPYVSPPTQRMWDIAALISEEQRDSAMDRFEVFREWFLKHILKIGRQNTLVLLPIESLEPRYRDEPPAPPIGLPKGISVLFLSPTLGSPELVVPIGEVPYKSRITAKIEHLPVAVAILAAPDMDVKLVNTIEGFLESRGRPTKVNIGSRCFEYGSASAP